MASPAALTDRRVDDKGWALAREDGERPEPPAFRAFLDILRSKQKPNATLLARLQELADMASSTRQAIAQASSRRPAPPLCEFMPPPTPFSRTLSAPSFFI